MLKRCKVSAELIYQTFKTLFYQISKRLPVGLLGVFSRVVRHSLSYIIFLLPTHYNDSEIGLPTCILRDAFSTYALSINTKCKLFNVVLRTLRLLRSFEKQILKHVNAYLFSFTLCDNSNKGSLQTRPHYAATNLKNSKSLSLRLGLLPTLIRSHENELLFNRALQTGGV